MQKMGVVIKLLVYSQYKCLIASFNKTQTNLIFYTFFNQFIN